MCTVNLRESSLTALLLVPHVHGPGHCVRVAEDCGQWKGGRNIGVGNLNWSSRNMENEQSVQDTCTQYILGVAASAGRRQTHSLRETHRLTLSLIAGASGKQPRRERPSEATLVGHLDGIACSP